MLRFSRKLASRAALSSSTIVLPSDLAFSYPRFTPQTHLSDALPELVQVKKMQYEAYAPGSNFDEIRVQLDRAVEIFNNIAPGGNIAANPAGVAAPVLRDWLGCAATGVRMEKLARTPARDKERIARLAPMVRAGKTADLKDLQVFDSLCVIAAAYADAAIRLATFGDGGIGSLDSWVGSASNLDMFRSPTPTVATFPELCTVVDRLIDGAYLAAVNKSAAAEASSMLSIKTTYTKLCALRGLIEIPCTGAMNSAIEWLDRPMRLRGGDDALLAVVVAMRAELRARLENSHWGLEAFDEQVDHDYLLAGERLYFYFPNCKPDSAITMKDMETLRDAYSSVALAKAAYYLAIPKDPAGDSPGVYTHHATRQLALSPLMLCPSGGSTQTDTSSKIPVKSSRAKRVALAEAERALKINRALYPHDKMNLKAGYILRILACTYAELKDYMYANGLFNSAAKVFEHHYGSRSLEVAELLRWQESFHRFVGSVQEADTLLGQINRIREENHVPPVGTLAAVGKQNAGVSFVAGNTKGH